MKKIAIVVAALAVIVLIGGLIVLGKVWNKVEKHQMTLRAAMPSKAPSKTTTVTASSSMQTAGAEEITVTGSNFTFEPKEIHVKKGQPVKVTLKNSSGIHDFLIDEFNVNSGKIKSGEQTTLTFTPDRTGTFQYYCSVANHRAMGMWGNLIVE